MTHPTRAFSGSIINRFTGSKILARVGQISVAFPNVAFATELCNGSVDSNTTHHGNGTIFLRGVLFEVEQNLKRTSHNSGFYKLQNYLLSGYPLVCNSLYFDGKDSKHSFFRLFSSLSPFIGLSLQKISVGD